MSGADDHPLRAWRTENGYTLDAAAAGVGTVRQVWYDWEIGRRIPDRVFMPRVYLFTGGRVTPNDFYDLPPLGQPDLPIGDAAPIPLFPAAGDDGEERQAPLARVA